MRSLPSAMTDILSGGSAQPFVLLCIVERPTTGTPVDYISDTAYTHDYGGGETGTYIGLVERWGEIKGGADVDPANVALASWDGNAILNAPVSTVRWTDKFDGDDYETDSVEYRETRVILTSPELLEDAFDSATLDTIYSTDAYDTLWDGLDPDHCWFKGYLRDIPRYDLHRASMQWGGAEDRAAQILNSVVTLTDYPKASPLAVGKLKPQPYGTVRFNGLPVVSGRRAVLLNDEEQPPMIGTGAWHQGGAWEVAGNVAWADEGYAMAIPTADVSHGPIVVKWLNRVYQNGADGEITTFYVFTYQEQSDGDNGPFPAGSILLELPNPGTPLEYLFADTSIGAISDIDKVYVNGNQGDVTVSPDEDNGVVDVYIDTGTTPVANALDVEAHIKLSAASAAVGPYDRWILADNETGPMWDPGSYGAKAISWSWLGDNKTWFDHWGALDGSRIIITKLEITMATVRSGGDYINRISSYVSVNGQWQQTHADFAELDEINQDQNTTITMYPNIDVTDGEMGQAQHLLFFLTSGASSLIEWYIYDVVYTVSVYPEKRARHLTHDSTTTLPSAYGTSTTLDFPTTGNGCQWVEATLTLAQFDTSEIKDVEVRPYRRFWSNSAQNYVDVDIAEPWMCGGRIWVSRTVSPNSIQSTSNSTVTITIPFEAQLAAGSSLRLVVSLGEAVAGTFRVDAATVTYHEEDAFEDTLFTATNETQSVGDLFEVSAEVQGYVSAHADYGTVGTLITNPAYIARFMLVKNLSWLASADTNDTAIDAAATRLAALGYQWDGVLLDRVSLIHFVKRLLFREARCRMAEVGGQIRIDVMEDAADVGASVADLTMADLVGEPEGGFALQKAMDMYRTGVARFYYGRDWTAGGDQESSYSDYVDGASGDKDRPEAQYLDWVTGDTQASDTAVFHGTRYRIRGRVMEHELTPKWLELEPGDVVTFAITDGAAATFDSINGSRKWIVERVDVRLPQTFSGQHRPTELGLILPFVRVREVV